MGLPLLGISPEVLSIIKVEKELEAVYCSRPGFVGADFLLEHAEKTDAFNSILELWSFYQAKGLSKGNAAPRIAKEVGLAESTIRKKLQGK